MRAVGRPKTMQERKGKLLYLDSADMEWFVQEAQRRGTNTNNLLRQAAKEFQERNTYRAN